MGELECFTVVSLTAGGDTNWVFLLGGGEDFDVNCAYSIVYGEDGNIYVAGTTGHYPSGQQFSVYSLTTGCNMNWYYKIPGCATSIVYDADGNIYAAGGISGLGFAVISLTIAGDTNWVYGYGNGGANSLVYGADGNIYAAGHISHDFAVISLTAAGDSNWVYRFAHAQYYSDRARSIVYGADGNVYAAGYISSDTGSAFVVVSFTTAGDTNWVYRYKGPGNSGAAANSIVYGTDGNIYAGGYSSRNGTSNDWTIISLTPAGDVNWIYWYDLWGGPDCLNCIVYGADGNLYCAGKCWGINEDFVVVSLNPELGIEEQEKQDPRPVTRDMRLTATPNPFSGIVEIQLCGVSENRRIGETVIHIYDISGREVRQISLLPFSFLLGAKATWDGRDDNGQNLPGGVYYAKLKIEDVEVKEKIILVR